MSGFICRFFENIIYDFSINVTVLALFIFYYFLMPDYWFLCSIFTLVVAAFFKVLFFKH